ncbi:MAG: WYL domain-containing protein [Clostridia bacterium]|nr:WYL domain-containing protein [Lachnospiraceae bacterium]NCC00724.1 WYL domain-containing protein [Clostridia bacterium]
MATERKEKLIRVLQIMESTDEKSPMNASQIVEKLDSKYTLGDIDRRSIYRDISMLQYCGYQITQCKDKRKGWYMEKHAFDDWEIKIMMDAVQQAKCVSEKETVEIREKLLALTSNRGRSRFSHMIRPVKDCSEVDVEIGQYIEMMLEAMFLHKKIEFQYTEITNDMEKVLRRNGKVYKLNLYTIYWASNNYYLIGSHDNHEGLTHYRLDRILNLCISDEYAIDAKEKVGPNPEMFIQNYIEESVNHYSGDVVRIEVEYEPDPAMNAILYDFAGKDVKVRKQKNGLYRASFTKMNSVTLIGWFLQYGNWFKVIAPEHLKLEVMSELGKALHKYED